MYAMLVGFLSDTLGDSRTADTEMSILIRKADSEVDEFIDEIFKLIVTPLVPKIFGMDRGDFKDLWYTLRDFLEKSEHVG